MGKNIITQRRGRGTTSFRAPSFKFKGESKVPAFQQETAGIVVDLIHCAAHTAPMAVIEYETGDVAMMIAPEKLMVGSELKVTTEEVKDGNVLALENIPEGTNIYNIEGQPGDGGKFVRASGAFAKVGPRVPTGITVIFPSKVKKVFNPVCRATVGIVAGGGRTEKPILKAGNAFYKAKARNHLWPVVSGSAMNAVAHPFGNKRTARKSKNRPISRNAPPGRKVGNVAARRTGQRKGK